MKRPVAISSISKSEKLVKGLKTLNKQAFRMALSGSKGFEFAFRAHRRERSREPAFWGFEEMGIILIAFSLFLMLIGSHAIGVEVKLNMTSDFKALLDAQWKNIKPIIPLGPGEDPGLGVFWQYRISPPFPSHWPPDESLQLIYYVYAAGLSPRALVDGEYVAAPWGRVEVDLRGTEGPKFRRLSEKLREIGIQGVRPLTQEEAAIFQKEPAAEAYLAVLTSLTDKNEKDVGMLRRYFCTWCQFNGHIVREIRPAHEEFFLWLGCK